MKLKNKIIILLSFFVLLGAGFKKANDFQDYNPTVIVEDHKFDSRQNKELLKGDKIAREFIAKNNYLGTVSIKFNTHNRVNSDYLQFKIKESDSNLWYYSNRYKVDQFQNNRYFPFGFPIINNSKDKKYQIEIKSLNGIKGNSVQVVMKDSPFLSRYSFPEAYLQQNKKEIPVFILSKVRSYLSHIDRYVYLTLLIISLLLIYLLTFININKFLDRFEKLDRAINKYNNLFLIKLKENKLINYFLIIASIIGLLIINLLINGPIRLKALAFNDDIATWHFFNINRNNFFGFIFDTGANKFRPVFLSALFTLFHLIGGNIWLFGIFNLIFNFFIAVILFLLFRKISKSIVISFCLSVAFILSRFAYYDITQALGLMEAMALLLSVLILYLLWRYLNTEKIKYFWVSIVMFLLLLLTHERFLTLLFLYLIVLLLLGLNRKNILLFVLSTLPVIFVWSLKILFLRIRPFDGTGGTDILQTFKISSFLQFFISGWYYLFGVNAGPTYLNGISSEGVPQNINNLILIGNLCLLLILTIFVISVLKSKKILFKNYINNFVLFFTFIFSTLLAASVTFRLEMRWLYAPFVGLLFLLAYMIGLILKQNFFGKICLLIIILWLGIVVQTEMFYRTNYKNLYYWGAQDLGNTLYDKTLAKYGDSFWSYKTYIICNTCTNKDIPVLNSFFKLFFKQFAPINTTPNIQTSLLLIKDSRFNKNESIIFLYNLTTNMLSKP